MEQSKIHKDLINYIQTTPESDEKWAHIAREFGMDLFDDVFFDYVETQKNNPRKWEIVARYFLLEPDQAENYFNDLFNNEDNKTEVDSDEFENEGDLEEEEVGEEDDNNFLSEDEYF